MPVSYRPKSHNVFLVKPNSQYVLDLREGHCERGCPGGARFMRAGQAALPAPFRTSAWVFDDGSKGCFFGNRWDEIVAWPTVNALFGNRPFRVEHPSMTSVVGEFSSQPTSVAAKLAKAETQPYAKRVLFV